MAFDLRLNDDGDLIFPLRKLTGDDLVKQRIRRRLRTFLGDWFLDPSIGLDYLGWIAQRPPPLTSISSRTRATVEATPGVDRILAWDASHDATNRRVNITGQVLLATGTTLELGLADERTEAGVPLATAVPWFLTITELL